jgi:hypothetical protein
MAKDVDFDIVVYDTYDFLDKLIGFKLSDIFYAAFKINFENTHDKRSLTFANLIKYGTSNEKEILMLRSLSRILDLFYNHSIFHDTIIAMNLDTKEKVKDFLTYLLNENVSFNTILNAKKGVALLQKYLENANYSQAQGLLSISWIENGYPLDSLPFGKVEKCLEVTPNMELISGDSEILTSRETRLWEFSWSNIHRIYAFNRKFKINAPGAIWQTN